MPVGVDEGREDETLLPFAVARVRRGPRTGLLYGAAGSNDFAACLIDDMRRGREIPTESGRLVFAVTSAFDPEVTVDPADIRRLSAEQSNTSIAIGVEDDAQAAAPPAAGHCIPRSRSGASSPSRRASPTRPPCSAPWSTSPRTAPARRSPSCRSSS